VNPFSVLTQVSKFVWANACVLTHANRKPSANFVQADVQLRMIETIRSSDQTGRYIA
jgi:hypothetical protein